MTEPDSRTDADRASIDRRSALKGGAAGLGLLALGSLGTGTVAASNGADRIYVSGSTREEHTLETERNGTTTSDPFPMLAGTIKTSTPTDMYLMAQLETALWTDIKSKGNDESSGAKAGITCWMEVDGTPVPVSHDYPNDWVADRQAASEVTLNYRDFRVEQNFLGVIEELDEVDEDRYLNLYQHTRSTHGFNWVALNVGSGDYDSSTNVHEVRLMGRLEVYREDGNDHAKAVVGPRTLVGVPAKLANDATI